MAKEKRSIALDPSVNNVGWASYERSSDTWTHGQWNLEGNSYLMRCRELAMNCKLEFGQIDELIIEWPAFYQSIKGFTAARQGYTIDLAGLGMYVAGFLRLNPGKIHLVTATEWKGTVTKVVTMAKFARIFGRPVGGLSDHVIDATMLLHFWLTRSKLTCNRLNPSKDLSGCFDKV